MTNQSNQPSGGHVNITHLCCCPGREDAMCWGAKELGHLEGLHPTYAFLPLPPFPCACPQRAHANTYCPRDYTSPTNNTDTPYNMDGLRNNSPIPKIVNYQEPQSTVSPIYGNPNLRYRNATESMESLLHIPQRVVVE